METMLRKSKRRMRNLSLMVLKRQAQKRNSTRNNKMTRAVRNLKKEERGSDQLSFIVQ